MKFSTREDIEAPADHVWAAVTDFQNFERQLLRRGADVTRDDSRGPGEGTEWTIRMTFRGKEREIDARVAEYDAPNTLRLHSNTGGLNGDIGVELVELSPRRTRLKIGVELKPTNLTARLLVQSLKFARTNLDRRFRDRIYDFAQDVEGRYRKAG